MNIFLIFLGLKDSPLAFISPDIEFEMVASF